MKKLQQGKFKAVINNWWMAFGGTQTQAVNRAVKMFKDEVWK